ncbi:hypothetical protein [Photobacterium leiognathi]|uniref:hypothetical protein n=1 Tax=Photobacterium leiognathi TaxID=553611 RepID=UPI002981EBA3|nr:hypothetical protein [Photobacterium leiognathi]
MNTQISSIDIHNYFEQSAGQFDAVNSEINALMIKHGFNRENFDYAGQTFKFNFISQHPIHRYTSIYYSVDQTLYRSSDHWSSLINANNANHDGITICGNIRLCYWSLRLNSDSTAIFGEHYRGGMIAGKVPFSALEINI